MTTITATTPAESEAAIANLKIGDVLRFEGVCAQRKVTKITKKPNGKVIVWTTGNGLLFSSDRLTGFFFEPAYKVRVKSFTAFELITAA